MGNPQPAGPDQEGRALVERLGGHWSADGGLCRCPAHDDRTPSLSVRPGRTRLLLHCFAGCSPEEILRALERGRLIEHNPPHVAAGAMRDEHRLSHVALRIWNESRPLQGTAAERYLARRAIHRGSSELRYHPRTPHGRSPLTAYRPALIAAVRDGSGLSGIHRIFIDPGNGALAALPNPKCGLGSFGGGAVRLGGSADRLGLAEGIETALSATALFGVPCWAALGTERFRPVALPAQVRELLLFLDHDSGGLRAERLARETFAHIASIRAFYPERPGDDWNDVLSRSAAGPHPFRDAARIG